MKLEALGVDQKWYGLWPQQAVTIVKLNRLNDDSVLVVYKTDEGQYREQLLERRDELRLRQATDEKRWRFSADPNQLKLLSEAQRIQWAHLFDPYLAIHSSQIQPLPHQITAVYERMLPRHPLRYLLADDPGAGKTVMAGLLIKELILRQDVHRCLIICPGSLAEQWQEELREKFGLSFTILTTAHLGSAENPFLTHPLAIGRMDQLARDPLWLTLVDQSEWDCIICDEAHKMAASFSSGEIKYTRRYQLGQRLSERTRHFLLMTATPHNGKEEEFQLFLALLDPDRFAGRFREGTQPVDTSDLMRRMVKEQLITFDGHPLFPQRRAETVSYSLSHVETELYEAVTNYVQTQFDRAEQLDNKRRGTVGFALTVLQRRLASSTAAITRSLQRRLERLTQRLQEVSADLPPALTELDFDADSFDEEELTAEEQESLEETITDEATTARTRSELQLEIATLEQLLLLAHSARRAPDRKWQELSRLLQEEGVMVASDTGQRRKLVIFTEHKDTLRYLAEQMRTLFGRPEAVVTIQGGLRPQERRAIEAAFRADPHVWVLLATDAAGEGINLQRAHLMINYDLPWNPNRLEQRFGRIHRIGQREVCHLWNLVAHETREGAVYQTLLHKLEREREALGGAVFDVLGQAISGQALRELLIKAIRYGDRADVRDQLHQQVEHALDTHRLASLVQSSALAHEVLSVGELHRVRAQMERIMARRLQPHFIASFFHEAFKQLGGTIYQREEDRWEITHLPKQLRELNRRLPERYERVCFEKSQIAPPPHSRTPLAELICPGHPLLDTMIELLLSQNRHLLTEGTIWVDPEDEGEEPHLLCYLQHRVQDGRIGRHGEPHIISQRFQFLLLSLDGETAQAAGTAPYLNYRPIAPEERNLVQHSIALAQKTLLDDQLILNYANTHLAPQHRAEVEAERLPLLDKIEWAVKQRLSAEIQYWDRRADLLRREERAGKQKQNRLNSANAQAKADEMDKRLKMRLAELEQERHITVGQPQIVGGALVIPAGLLARLSGHRPLEQNDVSLAQARKRIEQVAMQTVIQHEMAQGRAVEDVSALKLGYDIESADPQTQHTRLIEVKGRMVGAETVTITRNELLTARNRPDNWVLALVAVPPEQSAEPPALRYITRPFTQDPDWHTHSINFYWDELWAL